MTDQRVAGERPAGDRTRTQDGRGGGERARPPALSLGEVLTLCDRQLGEVGRRNHLFGWLRAPGGGSDAWLPVDAYYPRNRLVVLYRPRARAHDQVYRELVPEHGLRLLVLSPAELGTTAAGAERTLAAILARHEPAAAPPPTVSTRGSRRPVARNGFGDGDGPTSAPAPAPAPARVHARPSATERAERFLTTRPDRTGRPARRSASPASTDSPLAGVVVGLGLVLVLMVVFLYLVLAH